MTKKLQVRLEFEILDRDEAERLLAKQQKLKLPEMGDASWSLTLPSSPTAIEGAGEKE